MYRCRLMSWVSLCIKQARPAGTISSHDLYLYAWLTYLPIASVGEVFWSRNGRNGREVPKQGVYNFAFVCPLQ